jgi:aerobic carbon-monoxide dehydrogenase medium subunit
VQEEGNWIAIGSLTRHKDVASAPALREHCPIVSFTAGKVGDPQVRHRGTVGGSLAHGDPASDLPAVILALGGELVARGPDGDRAIPATEFFTGVFQTALASTEMLVEVRVPKLGSAGWSYTKMSRRAQDWATVAVAAVVHGNGSIERASVALANMGATPLHAVATQQALASGASIEDAAALAAEETEPPSDHAASSDFRRHLARVLTRRALEEATAR